MFNLVTLQDKSDPANIIIKTYSDVFIKNTQGTTLKDRGINFDWTDKVDLKDIKLTPLNDLKNVLYLGMRRRRRITFFVCTKNLLEGICMVVKYLVRKG